jgi:aspartate/methionine/tyrosine aminotransferase
MPIAEFKLERYFAAHEFNVRYLLGASDCEGLTLRELLALADGETRALWEQLGLGYTESPGHPLLRAAIAGLYQGLEPDDVLVASPQELIYLAMHVLLEPGDHVVAIHPAYQSLQSVAESLGCRVTRWSVRPAGAGWTLDLAELEAALTARTRLIVVNFPHNPTGYLPPRDFFDALLALGAARGVRVFSDEMYRLLEYDPAARLPAACEPDERAVTLSGLSKSFALPGLRIGWLATRDRALLARCNALKDYTTICSSAPSEILALIGLRARATVLARSHAIVAANLAIADDFFARQAERFDWLRPQAGSVAFPALAGEQPVGEFCERLRTTAGVLLVPAPIFDYAGNHFRLGLGRRNFGEAIGALEAHLDAVLAPS